MRNFQFIALTPSASAESTLAIAASRADGIGLLNLAFSTVPQAKAAIARLVRYTDKLCGIRLVSSDSKLVSKILNDLPDALDIVVLTAPVRKKRVSQLHNSGKQVWIEITNQEQALNAEKMGADALVAKGSETGGFIGSHSAQTLLRQVMPLVDLPVYVFGGISAESVGAIYLAGAAGVILSDQLTLLKESKLPQHAQQLIATLDGSETIAISATAGKLFSIYDHPTSSLAQQLEDHAQNLTAKERRKLHVQLANFVGWGDPAHTVWPLGKDVSLAATFAQEYSTVTQTFKALAKNVEDRVVQAIESGALSAESPLAQPYLGSAKQPEPSDIAIIGISSILPKSADTQTYWENIVNSVYAISEVPGERWDKDLYFDADRTARDKIYSIWGGFIDDVPFDPLAFGMPPKSLNSIDPMQLLALKVAAEAMRDANCASDYNHQQTGIILGASGGLGDVGTYYLLRSMLPTVLGEQAQAVIDANGDILPEWTEDSFAGLLPNVSAGRIANRLDFGGVNMVVDAACGSSLAAVHLGVRELEAGSADMMIVGGVDTIQSPFGFMCFSATQALSPHGIPKTFDQDSDGIAISEGAVMLVLKRRADAERDGDKIYALIRGSSGSSDGKALGMTAPRPEGQLLALQRAYNKAGIDPRTVGLFEAHGTGTAVGDRTEASSLGTFLQQNNAPANRYPIGSVKSMIGHTKAAAGVAGLAKIVLALHHKVLPPTLNVTTPNPKANFGSGPLYVNAETRPWIQQGDVPRRAGVSAFGFGGTNFHVVAEEYQGDYLDEARSPLENWPSELLVFSAETQAQLDDQITQLQQAIQQGAQPRLADLAYTLWQNFDPNAAVKQAIVATSINDLASKPPTERVPTGKLAFLFSGQGAQYPNMLRDLAIYFDEVRESFELADGILADQFEKPLSSFVYPPPAFDSEARERQKADITATNVAQPALGSADIGAYKLLKNLGVTPDMAAGHSYGEYAALCAAGVIDEATLATLSEARGRCIVEAAKDDLGTMAAVSAEKSAVEQSIADVDEVWLANMNAPTQTIISGSERGIAKAITRLKERRLSFRKINVAAAFHTPIVAPAQKQFDKYLAKATYGSAEFPVYSNTTAKPHSRKARTIQKTLSAHLAAPVRFVEEIEAMYAAGARVFVEVGPHQILTKLTQKILGDRPHVAVAIDKPKAHGVTQLQHALAQLLEANVPVTLDRFFAGRRVRALNLADLVADTQPTPLKPTTWLLNGGRVRPQGQKKIEKSEKKPVTVTIAASDSADNAIAAPAHVQAAPQPNVAPQPPPVQAPPPSLPNLPLPNGSVTDPEFVTHYQRLMEKFLETQRDVMVAASGRAGGKAQVASGADQQTVGKRPVIKFTPPAVVPAPLPIVTPAAKVSAKPMLPRTLLQPVALPLGELGGLVSAESKTLIINMGSSLARGLGKKLKASKSKVINGSKWASVDAARAAVASKTKWDGVVYLLPNKPLDFAALSLETWRSELAKAIKFLWVVSAEISPSQFMLIVAHSDKNVAHGGVSGYVKTLAQEWPDVRVQLVDGVDSAEIITNELSVNNPAVHVQYVNGVREGFGQVAGAKLQVAGSVSAEDVVVVTGGARGITAQVALDLARKQPLTLILIGRSPQPGLEDAATAGISDSKALKAALIAAVKQSGERVVLAEIERQFNYLLKQREMRSNLADLIATGATVRYFSADCRDEEALTHLLNRIEQDHGAITGVIHGAGVIEDKKIGEKSAESFDRVFDTKTDAAFILSRAVNPEKLKFMAFFSSASGAFGNVGQCDYAAANATLNALATHLNAQWSAKVVATCWGPWANEGMVSAELQAQFAARGIDLIDIPAGCTALYNEIMTPNSEAVVVYAPGDWGASSKMHVARGSELPMGEAIRIFDPKRDLYLDHHRLDGTPVLPAAVGTEWMAEVAQAAHPDLVVTAVHDLKVMKGIVFKEDAPIELTAVIEESVASGDGVRVGVKITSAASKLPHYSATIELQSALPAAPDYNVLPEHLEPLPISIQSAYEQWLFHGPVFQAITEISGGAESEILVAIAPSVPQRAVSAETTGDWLFDPIVVDSALQAALIWARHNLDMTPLPLGFKHFQRYGSLSTSGQPIRAYLQFKNDAESRTLSADIALVGADGKIVATIETAHCSYSPMLNRLAGNETYAPLERIRNST